jgi:choline dehydrogenase-like flavoprotein
LDDLGVPKVYDPDEGITAGGYFLASDIQPNNQTRSDARRAYYDPFFSRKNYNILQNSHVTRLIFDDSDLSLPQYSASENGSWSDIGNISKTQRFARARKVHHAGNRQPERSLALHAAGVEV